MKRKIEALLSSLIKDSSFERLKEIIKELPSPYFFLMDVDGKFLYSEGEACQQMDEGICKRFIIDGFRRARNEKKAFVLECKNGFFGFFSPIFLDDDFMGLLTGCRIAQYEVPLGFREIGGEKTKKGFVSFTESLESSALKKILEREAALISAYASSSLKILFKNIELEEKEDEILAISESYKLFSGEYGTASSL
ncbi:MAG: hypothetical protein AB1595_03150, partial [bacterium]